jgi:glycerophosphoryl diester phosphodiesterase
MTKNPVKPMLIAHRGGSLEAPENTLASFRHAIEVGVEYVELDVQMSKDGVLVVIHDETLDRTTNGTGLVGDYTYAELKKLDAGSHFAPEYRGETIPTLRDVLELCAKAGVGVVLELKSPHLYPGMVEKTAILLADMKAHGAHNYWCISFDHDAIRHMHTLEPSVSLGYLYEPTEQTFVFPDATVQAYCPYFRTALAHPDQVARALNMGKHVLVYTVNDADDIRRLSDIGVAGIVTDRPAALRASRRS